MLSMTQDEFAEHCNVSRISIARYEAGAEINRSNAVKVASACGVSVEYVLGITDDMGKEEASKEEMSNLVPKTLEARIVSFGMDKLPQEERQKILDILQRMYDNNPDIFKEEQAQ
jgi:transcriptional regulator with XRE-family HTH domain